MTKLAGMKAVTTGKVPVRPGASGVSQPQTALSNFAPRTFTLCERICKEIIIVLLVGELHQPACDTSGSIMAISQCYLKSRAHAAETLSIIQTNPLRETIQHDNGGDNSPRRAITCRIRACSPTIHGTSTDRRR
jgi:glutaredoxin-related protein